MLVNSGELKLSPEWRIGSHSRELPKAKGSLHPEADLEDDEEEGPWPEEAVSHPRPTPRLMSHCRGDTRLTSWPQGRASPVVQSAPPSSRWDHVLTELFFFLIFVW